MATRNLYRGCTGSDVKTLQSNLKKLGYYKTGALDGSFGSLTDTAVRQYQRANGLVVDGVVGPKTRAAMSGKLKKKTKKVVKKKTTKKKSTTVTMEMGRWNGHKFTVSPTLIRGFSGLQIKGSCELKDKKDSKQGYVSRKGANPTEVTLTVHLNAFTGCDPRTEALQFVSDAKAGKQDYFYVGSKKLISEKLMLTEASVKEVAIAHNNAWVKADVQLTMKQSGKSGSSSSSSKKSSGSSGAKSSGGSGSNKVSVKSSTPTTTKKTSWVQKAVSQVKTDLNKLGNVIKTGANNMNVSSANAYIKKTAAIAKGTTTTVKYGGTRYAMTK